MIKQLTPARVTPPGRILIREIEARGWTQKDLAEIMGRPPQAINEIIKGTKQITPETAIELSAAFGTSAQFWTNLESNYRLHLAQKEAYITR
jgi:addiction module HigA family antidote